MEKTSFFTIILVSVLVAISAVLVLKFVGYGNPVVIGGGIAGGVAGALISSLSKKKKDE